MKSAAQWLISWSCAASSAIKFILKPSSNDFSDLLCYELPHSVVFVLDVSPLTLVRIILFYPPLHQREYSSLPFLHYCVVIAWTSRCQTSYLPCCWLSLSPFSQMHTITWRTLRRSFCPDLVPSPWQACSACSWHGKVLSFPSQLINTNGLGQEGTVIFVLSLSGCVHKNEA